MGSTCALSCIVAFMTLFTDPEVGTPRLLAANVHDLFLHVSTQGLQVWATFKKYDRGLSYGTGPEIMRVTLSLNVAVAI